jgi:hemerythrin-like domain-containing protein
VKPIGSMMIEHRLIERMISLMGRELSEIEKNGQVDPLFIDSAVDFLRTYADRTHHGKEERIYFRDLAEKDLTKDLRRIMDELLAEHVYARGKVRDLVAAKERYVEGRSEVLKEVLAILKDLVTFYPGHIEKEDKRFFFPTQEYFNLEEQESMLREFFDFDAKMIHEKYSSVVEQYEVGRG